MDFEPIGLASDHAGFELKRILKNELEQMARRVLDLRSAVRILSTILISDTRWRARCGRNECTPGADLRQRHRHQHSGKPAS